MTLTTLTDVLFCLFRLLLVVAIVWLVVGDFQLRIEERKLRRRMRAVGESFHRVIAERDELQRELDARRRGGTYR